MKAATDPMIDDRDWSALTLGQRIRQVELEGYLVIPDLLSPEHIGRLKDQAEQLETKARHYSQFQQSRADVQFEGGPVTELIAHPPTIEFLRELFGDDMLFLSYVYDRSEPGTPGISLHTDGQPYGSKIFGHQGSCPCTVRVLYYLDDLTPQVSPFRVVPHSHLSMHDDANPYKRYESHPEQVLVTCRAGSAVFLNHRTFHGTFPNVGGHTRSLLAIAYRPAWSGPVLDVPNWDETELEKLSPQVRSFFDDPNTRNWDFGSPDKPDNMASEAPGMDPSRWDRA